MTTSDLPSGGGPYGSPPTKQALSSWWQQFRNKSKPGEKDSKNDKDRPTGIFGVPLYKSIEYANVAISLTDANGQSFIYGYVPIVVAKCGVFLKEKATDIEGIFRLSGSAKRIKDLQNIFNSPDKYGKGLDWTGYTVHDAANVLRRYLNQLPEPIIPLQFYHKFREPLTVPNFDPRIAIKVYQNLIGDLPPLNRQLLLYILDLLAVFASKSDQNLMTSQNLSAIFQPGLISHPDHDMSPENYRLSQDVLVFLIENQDHFLLGMGGHTDEKSHPPGVSPPTPTMTSSPRRSKTMISRSPSNSSAAAEDVRKNGGIRRNASVSSRKSAPSSPKIGVSRSNTLPSRRSQNSRPNSFRPSGPSTPTFAPPNTTVDTTSPPQGGQMTENVSPVTPKPIGNIEQRMALNDSGPKPADIPMPVSNPGSPQLTPSKERNIATFFNLTPGAGDAARPINRLKKKRLPGSTNPSAESSTTSLPSYTPSSASHQPPVQAPHTPLETVPQSPLPIGHQNFNNNHVNFLPQATPSSARDTQVTLTNQPSTAASSGTLMPAISPTHSATSSATSQTSDQESQAEQRKNRKSLWRKSASSAPKCDKATVSPGPTSPSFSPPPSRFGSPSKKSNGHHHYQDQHHYHREESRDRNRDRRERSSSEGGGGSGDDNKGKGAFGWLQKKMSERSARQNRSEQQVPEDREVNHSNTSSTTAIIIAPGSNNTSKHTFDEILGTVPPPPPPQSSSQKAHSPPKQAPLPSSASIGASPPPGMINVQPPTPQVQVPSPVLQPLQRAVRIDDMHTVGQAR